MLEWLVFLGILFLLINTSLNDLCDYIWVPIRLVSKAVNECIPDAALVRAFAVIDVEIRCCVLICHQR